MKRIFVAVYVQEMKERTYKKNVQKVSITYNKIISLIADFAVRDFYLINTFLIKILNFIIFQEKVKTNLIK